MISTDLAVQTRIDRLHILVREFVDCVCTIGDVHDLVKQTETKMNHARDENRTVLAYNLNNFKHDLECELHKYMIHTHRKLCDIECLRSEIRVLRPDFQVFENDDEYFTDPADIVNTM